MNKNFYLFALLIAIIFSAQTAFADVKIKTRQTMSGQTYESATFIKGKRQRTEQNMGSVKTVSLTQCDLRRYVQMNPASKTYLVNQFNAAVAENPQTVAANEKTTDKVVRAGGTITTTLTTKDTGERKQMFGFPAKHLIITMQTVSSPDACSPSNTKMQFDGWYIDAEFVLNCNQNYGYANNSAGKNGGCQDKHQMKQIGAANRGYPVYEKMTMFDESGKETFSTVSEVVELSKATLDAALFEIPTDYREVSDAAQMYNVAQTDDSTDSPNSAANSGNAANSTMKLPAQSSASNTAKPAALAAKQPGIVRIGVTVKTGAVGEGIAAADLAAAVQNTFGEFLKGTKIEVVPLEAKLAALVDGEASKKECDFVLYASVAHKKGGGGFGGMFGKMAPVLGSLAPVAGMGGSVAGAVAGQVASTAIISASQVSSNVKSKDEITLDIKLNQTGGAAVLTRQFKNKAKSDGEDILSPIIEQAAEAIVTSAKK